MRDTYPSLAESSAGRRWVSIGSVPWQFSVLFLSDPESHRQEEGEIVVCRRFPGQPLHQYLEVKVNVAWMAGLVEPV